MFSCGLWSAGRTARRRHTFMRKKNLNPTLVSTNDSDTLVCRELCRKRRHEVAPLSQRPWLQRDTSDTEAYLATAMTLRRVWAATWAFAIGFLGIQCVLPLIVGSLCRCRGVGATVNRVQTVVLTRARWPFEEDLVGVSPMSPPLLLLLLLLRILSSKSKL